MPPPISCQAKLYVILDLKISTEVLNFDMIHSIYQIKVVLPVFCSIPKSKTTFGYPLFSELSYGRYPENDFKTFLTITILEIISIVRQLSKLLDRNVLLISPRYW